MKRFAFCLVSVISSLAQAETESFNHRPIQAEVQRDLNSGKLLETSKRAFEAMFHVAQNELQARGESDLAEQLEQEWQTVGADSLAAMLAMNDTGDHLPFSLWVQTWYAKIEAILGIPVMEATHLRDIWVLNYTLPVVFHAPAVSQWCLENSEQHPADNCRDEYRRHFAGTKYQQDPDPEADKILHHGFAGVVTYWLVWAGCQAATSGIGSYIICSPAGNAAEFGVERWVAPRIAYRLYDRANDNLTDHRISR